LSLRVTGKTAGIKKGSLIVQTLAKPIHMFFVVYENLVLLNKKE